MGPQKYFLDDLPLNLYRCPACGYINKYLRIHWDEWVPPQQKHHAHLGELNHSLQCQYCEEILPRTLFTCAAEAGWSHV